MLRLAAIALLLLFLSAHAWGCTVCSSDAGRALRTGITAPGFATTFLAACAPVPWLIIAALTLARVLGKPRKDIGGGAWGYLCSTNAFLASGLVLIASGWAMVRAGKRV